MKNKLIIILFVLLVLILGTTSVAFTVGKLTKNENSTPIKATEEKITEEDLEIEGFKEYNEELSSAVREPKHNEKELLAANSEMVYYSQIDPDWRWHPYTSIGDYSQTIGTSGCGPTSAAMIVSSIRGVVYPDEMRRFICR